MSETKTMIKALRILSQEIQSGDGVANACVADAANMICGLSEQLAKANERADEILARLGESEARLASSAITGSGVYPSEALNKFAIDNQIKALVDSKDFNDKVIIAACQKSELGAYAQSNLSGGFGLIHELYCVMADKVIEQLRKEQVSEYEFREIGESDWIPCDKDWFDYCQRSPEHEARLLKEQE